MNKICTFLGLGLICSLSFADAFSVKEALHLVIKSHPEVMQQEAALRVAGLEVGIAKQQFWPTPSVSTEQVQASALDSQYQGDARVTLLRLQQPLWTGGRLTASLEKAKSTQSVRAAALEEIRQQLALSTVQTWGDWCASQARLAVVQRNLSLHLELQSRLQRRVQEGASAPADLTLTEGRVVQVSAQLQANKSQADLARFRLQQLLGKPLAVIDCHWPEPRQAHGEELNILLPQALDKSPALARLRAQRDQAHHDVDQKRAELFPEVFVRAEHQRGHFNLAAYPNTNRIFVGFNTRLGAGLSTVQQIESALQLKLGSEQELAATERKVTEQVQTLWIQARDIQTRLPSIERLVRANLSTQEAWDRQFLAGKKSWLDVMNAARELMQSEIDLADARVNEKSLQWRLALMVQGVDEVLSVHR